MDIWMKLFLQLVAVFFLIVILFAFTHSRQRKFDKIKEGMDMQEVIKLLGNPINSREIDVSGKPGVSSTWKIKDNEIGIIFLNNKVQIKTANKIDKHNT